MSKVLQALISIQGELKSPKDQAAKQYRYRNIEAVNEAVKPLAAKHGCAVVYSDEAIEIDGNLFCQATCRLIGEDSEICATALSLIETKPQYMGKEQSTGAASSYARKYAACGLFAIDDSSNDPDKTNAGGKQAQKKPAANLKKPGRFDRITVLKTAAAGLGIVEEDIKAWLDSTFVLSNGAPKPMGQFTAAEIKQVEKYLEECVATAKAAQ